MAACARAHKDPAASELPGTTATTSADEADGGGAPGAGAGDESSSTSTSTSTSTNGGDAGIDGVEIFAFLQQAPIFNATEWPSKDPSKTAEERVGVVRLGYLRRGEKAYARPGKITKANCAEGWYQLVGREAGARGFVCGKFVTTDPKHKELRWAPHAPYMDRNLPYEYGLNLTPGTPLYPAASR